MNRLRMALRGRYPAEDVRFLEPYLKNSPESIQILILKILCLNGNPVINYVDLFKNPSSMLTAEMIRLAKTQDDTVTILELAKENRKNAHLAILTLKEMGRTDCLMAFMLSPDEELAKLALEQ